MSKAYEIPGKFAPFTNGVDFTGKKYVAVNLNSAGKLVVATAGGPIVGIVQEPNVNADHSRVMLDGISFCQLKGTVAEGAAVEVGADGKVIAHSSGTAIGVCVAGGTDTIGSIIIK